MTSAVMPTYARIDLAFERGEGAYLFTTDGRRFLDFGSGVAVTALGHAHPHLAAALSEQAAKLWHTSNLYQVPGQIRLAERLCAASFADRAFFCNSGAEAVEASVKLARRTQHARGFPQRTRVIVAESAFHGRTLGMIAAGGTASHREGFGAPLPGFDRVAFGNLNETRMAVGEETAAILVEPIQGEGGINVPDEDFLNGLRALCDEFGLLLICDEVQTGMGRTGRLFGYQHSRVAPDIMALAKGLGGGFPVGACLATADAAAGFTPGTHGSTFGGNPLAMAAANAVLDVILEPGFLDRVVEMGDRLRAELAEIAATYPAVIREVRGRGLMLGLVCGPPNGDVAAALRDRGLLTVNAGGNVVRLLPPLIIGDAEIERAAAAIRESCAVLEAAQNESLKESEPS